ncbi:Conserved hypothetical protein [Ramlibacter tataouinensis TTB310]|uniref:Uncharacterized protein n=2 Tax=Ramlibacter tataouinensis TaxID=94132 RepID=F5Y1C7_RAMTT|nr:Conserved hypothetical protein [Ramlibacter tataouinensis TTB310]
MGLKLPHLEEMLKELLLDEGERLLRSQGVKPNISQLAVTTGLNRKQVTARVRALIDPLPATGLSAAARTFTSWLQLSADRPERARLPIASTGGGDSFQELARQASRSDVHHRAVLDELVRLGLCREADGFVELAADGFVPTADLKTTLAFLGDNLRDHASAAVTNALAGQALFLERAVFADGLEAADCEATHQLVRQRWNGLHHELVQSLTRAVDRNDGQGPQRIRIGIYLYAAPKDETP